MSIEDDLERGREDAGGTFYRLHTAYLHSANQSKRQLDALSKMVSELSSPKDSHGFRADLNNSMESTKTDLDSLKQILVSLEQACSAEKEQVITAQVGADLQAMLSRFQELQQKAKSTFERFVLQANIVKKREEDFEPSEKEPLVSPQQQQIQKQVLQEEINYNEQLIEERERGIREIEAAMMDVREIFRDLGLLVSEQQLGIDHIEANIEAAAMQTKDATEELDRANESRKRRAWTVYSFFLTLLILLVVLFVILML